MPESSSSRVLLQRPGAEEDEIGRLKGLFAGGVDVRDAAWRGRRFALSYSMRRTQQPLRSVTALLLLDERQQRIGRLRLGADHAAEAVAESAVEAAGPRDAVGIGVRGAERRGGIWIRMIAERFRRVVKKRRVVGHLRRRRGIFFAARALEDIAALDYACRGCCRLCRKRPRAYRRACNRARPRPR